MDKKGFIFTFDAVLALIPLFLTIILISNLSVAPNSQSQVIISQSAQDCLDILAASQIEERTVMESMVLTLKTDKENEIAKMIVMMMKVINIIASSPAVSSLTNA